MHISLISLLEIEEHAKELSIVGDEQERQRQEHEDQLNTMYAAHDKEKHDLLEGNAETLRKMEGEISKLLKDGIDSSAKGILNCTQSVYKAWFQNL